MARLPENYLGPKHRIEMLKSDHPTNSAIKTVVEPIQVQSNGNSTLCFLVRAEVLIDDKVVATGHAFTDSPEEQKALEKAETIAIGRALVNAGYPEKNEEESTPTVSSRPVSSGGLGIAKTPLGGSNVSQVSSVSKESVSAPKPTGLGSAPPRGLGSNVSAQGSGIRAGNAAVAEVFDEEEVETEEKDEDLLNEHTKAAEAIPQVTEEKPVSAAPKAMTKEELLAKFRKKA